MKNAELKLIPLADLVDHPDNPRILYREDVIDAIVANLGNEWPQKHALHVRPLGKQFQILAGHTRKRAAEKKGISEVWCWVEDMDDAQALRELLSSFVHAEYTNEEKQRWLDGFVKHEKKQLQDKINLGKRIAGIKPQVVAPSVYILHAVGSEFYKIGFTRYDISRRLAELSTASPFPLRVLAVFEVDRPEIIEKQLHEKFSVYRRNGEWFEFTESKVTEAVSFCKQEVHNAQR